MNSLKYFTDSLNSQQPPKIFFSYAQTHHNWSEQVNEPFVKK